MFGLNRLLNALAELAGELLALAQTVRRCREGVDAALGAAGEDPWRVVPAAEPAPAADANGNGRPARKARVGP